MSNPLLTFTDLPPFSQIQPEHIKPAVEQVISECRAKIEEVLEGNTNPTWESVVAPIEQADDRLNRVWSPVGHMNAVVNSEALREAIRKLSASVVGIRHLGWSTQRPI